MKFSLLFRLKPLVIDFWHFAPKRITLVIFFMLLSSVTASIGILFIVPLLEAINVDLGSHLNSTTNLNSNIGDKITIFFQKFGISLDLLTVLLIYLCVVIFKAIISFIDSVLSVKLQRDFVLRLRSRLYRKLFYSEWQFLNQEHMPDFIRLVTGQVEMAGYSLQQLLNLCSNIILVCVYLTLALFVSPTLTLLAITLAVLLILVMLPINALIFRSGGKELMANTDIFRDIFEQISSIKIIKSFSAEEKCLSNMYSTNTQLENQHVKMTMYSAFTRVVNLVGAAIIFTILFYTSIQWLQLPVANLLIILFIFSRLMPQVSGLQNIIMQLIHQAPSYIDLLDKTEQLSKHAETPTNTPSFIPEFTKSLELSGISYRYPTKQEDAISNIHALIKFNESIAITGPSGKGKSTVADIVAGLTKPSSGSLIVDGQAIDDSNRHLWRKKVAYVTQDMHLFHDTVRHNLTFLCDTKLIEKDLWSALKLAAADDFVKQLPNGLDTLIGDNGIKLSGGERQRLALARALLSEPKILILDEATSSLDRENELKIRDALIQLNGQLAIIVIAHNDTTIEHIDKRITLS